MGARYVSVPEPDETAAYIADALEGQEAGHMLPWVVRETGTGAITGSTRYHDVVPHVDRVKIGYTWYEPAAHARQHDVQALLLLAHAFDTLGCNVVGLRTDPFNFRSQRAIEALGVRKDGVLRHSQHAPRRHGARHGDVQHPRQRMARCPEAPAAPAASSRDLNRMPLHAFA